MSWLDSGDLIVVRHGKSFADEHGNDGMLPSWDSCYRLETAQQSLQMPHPLPWNWPSDEPHKVFIWSFMNVPGKDTRTCPGESEKHQMGRWPSPKGQEKSTFLLKWKLLVC